MSDKTFTFEVDVLPNTSSTLNLGTSTKKWKINGVTPGDAMEKSVDSSISSGSTSTGLPTSQAVVNYVEGEKDVLQYDDYSDFPLTGVASVIYIDATTDTQYRWDGTTSTYISISGTPTPITNSEIDALFT